MKTQVNEFRTAQEPNNKIRLFSLLLLGSIILIVSGVNIYQSSFYHSENSFGNFSSTNPDFELVDMLAVDINEGNELTGLIYIAAREAEFSKHSKNTLEIEKLDKRISGICRQTYQQMLYDLANVEEPELLIEDVVLQLKSQKAAFYANYPGYYPLKHNAYLEKLYKEKNERVWKEIEQSHKFDHLLAEENENNLSLEPWMTDGGFWELMAAENSDVEEKLANAYKQKNEEVYQSIEMDFMLCQLAQKDEESPMQVETWMINNSEQSDKKAVEKNEYLANMASHKKNEVDEMLVLLKKAKCCGVIEIEEPLAVESWMISDRCWCPDKKRQNLVHNESFAMSETK